MTNPSYVNSVGNTVTFSSTLPSLDFSGIASLNFNLTDLAQMDSSANYYNVINSMLSVFSNVNLSNITYNYTVTQSYPGGYPATTTTNTSLTPAQLGITNADIQASITTSQQSQILESFFAQFSSSNPLPTTLAGLQSSWISYVNTQLTSNVQTLMQTAVSTAQNSQSALTAAEANLSNINNLIASSGQGDSSTPEAILNYQSLAAQLQSTQTAVLNLGGTNASALQTYIQNQTADITSGDVSDLTTQIQSLYDTYDLSAQNPSEYNPIITTNNPAAYELQQDAQSIVTASESDTNFSDNIQTYQSAALAFSQVVNDIFNNVFATQSGFGDNSYKSQTVIALANYQNQLNAAITTFMSQVPADQISVVTPYITDIQSTVANSFLPQAVVNNVVAASTLAQTNTTAIQNLMPETAIANANAAITALTTDNYAIEGSSFSEALTNVQSAYAAIIATLPGTPTASAWSNFVSSLQALSPTTYTNEYAGDDIGNYPTTGLYWAQTYLNLYEQTAATEPTTTSNVASYLNSGTFGTQVNSLLSSLNITPNSTITSLLNTIQNSGPYTTAAQVSAQAVNIQSLQTAIDSLMPSTTDDVTTMNENMLDSLLNIAQSQTQLVQATPAEIQSSLLTGTSFSSVLSAFTTLATGLNNSTVTSDANLLINTSVIADYNALSNPPTVAQLNTLYTDLNTVSGQIASTVNADSSGVLANSSQLTALQSAVNSQISLIASIDPVNTAQQTLYIAQAQQAANSAFSSLTGFVTSGYGVITGDQAFVETIEADQAAVTTALNNLQAAYQSQLYQANSSVVSTALAAAQAAIKKLNTDYSASFPAKAATNQTQFTTYLASYTQNSQAAFSSISYSGYLANLLTQTSEPLQSTIALNQLTAIEAASPPVSSLATQDPSSLIPSLISASSSYLTDVQTATSQLSAGSSGISYNSSGTVNLYTNLFNTLNSLSASNVSSLSTQISALTAPYTTASLNAVGNTITQVLNQIVPVYAAALAANPGGDLPALDTLISSLTNAPLPYSVLAPIQANYASLIAQAQSAYLSTTDSTSPAIAQLNALSSSLSTIAALTPTATLGPPSYTPLSSIITAMLNDTPYRDNSDYMLEITQMSTNMGDLQVILSNNPPNDLQSLQAQLATLQAASPQDPTAISDVEARISALQTIAGNVLQNFYSAVSPNLSATSSVESVSPVMSSIESSVIGLFSVDPSILLTQQKAAVAQVAAAQAVANQSVLIPTDESITDGQYTGTQTVTGTVYGTVTASMGSTSMAQGLTTDINTINNQSNDIINNGGVTYPGGLLTATQTSAFYSQFVKGYNYTSASGTTLNQTGSFFGQLSSALGVTATVGNNSTGSITQGTQFTDPASATNLLSYQAVYTALYPNSTTAQFQTAFNTFYNAQVAANGSFVPSQEFAAWVSQNTTQYIGGLGPSSLNLTTSLASMDAGKVAIINNVFGLIITLLNTLQNIAALQAAQLNILTEWQNAYTNELSTIHTFLNGTGEGVNIGATNEGSLNDLNNNYRSYVQTLQQTVGDTSKSMQSNINQTNDAVTQQATMATSLIQELSTLLTAIFQ